MRVFVSEYVCGGAWLEKTLNSSLAAEGRAMLVALIEDLLRLPGIDVVTTWDQRLGDFPVEEASTLSIVPISSPLDERRAFERLCEESAAAFVIAPEFHGILADRAAAASLRTRLIGCDQKATALCSDKLKLAEFLEASGIWTVPTEGFVPETSETSLPNFAPPFPSVIKPQDGAGSVMTFNVSTAAELSRLSAELLTDSGGFEFVRQPFIEGVAVSCAAVVSTATCATDTGSAATASVETGSTKCDSTFAGPLIDVLPPCRQILSDDGRFRYQGANFPAGIERSDLQRVERLVRHCCSVIPGLHGFVGFDLLVPSAENAEPIIVEINPRLTTGFLLWQKLCNDNLVSRMLAADDVPPDESPLSWKSGSDTFRMSSLPE
ncbi:MAG: ATP-grasp domain-containing protein [Rhodopirellula sp.]|nr:ATP-grasp domain-containing protein [Rhodopirellula sp.]